MEMLEPDPDPYTMNTGEIRNPARHQPLPHQTGFRSNVQWQHLLGSLSPTLISPRR
jgi:hypothetical protein